MTSKNYVRSILLASLMSMALGGLLLHLRLHPIAEEAAHYIPFVACLLTLLAIPCLMSQRRFVEYGYVLNGMLVILGTVTMGHFSLAHWPVPATAGSILLKTMLPDILILWGLFFVGKALFDLELFGYDPDRQRGGKTYRYPNLGWWAIHVVVISAVYALGHFLWR